MNKSSKLSEKKFKKIIMKKLTKLYQPEKMFTELPTFPSV